MQTLGLLTAGLAYFLLAASGLSFVFTGWALSVLLAVVSIAIYALHRVIVRRACASTRATTLDELQRRINRGE